jgi:hypothetical protein
MFMTKNFTTAKLTVDGGHFPSSFFLPASSFFLLPSSFFLLLPSSFFLLPSSFFLLLKI